MAELARDAEAARLDALQRLALLDTSPTEAFDRITRMAAQIFGLPIAAVSLTDRDRQWFKSRVGVDHCSIPRAKAPCAEVATRRCRLVVPDLLADAFYADSNLAAQGIRFYAGAQLVTRDGHGLGALCVLGTEPREASAAELAALDDLAAMVMAQIELQHAFGRIDPVSRLPSRQQFIEDVDDLERECPGGLRIAALVDLAPPEQLSQGLRVLGSGFLDDMVSRAAPLIQAAVAPGRLYHVATTQFAVLAGEGDVDGPAYGEALEMRLRRLRQHPGLGALDAAAIGVLPFALGTRSPVDVLRTAYGAALDARGSRSAVRIHSASSDDAHQRRFRLLADFEAALAASDQLRLVIQPRVDLAGGGCNGGEALLRWRHPEFGDISPGEFIPPVELSSLARPMTDWVLGRAFEVLSQWRGLDAGLRLSANISAENLTENDLARRVEQLLRRHRLPPAALELEVTESAAIFDDSRALEQLTALAGAGVSIAIDDFGTGYGSLSYLRTLPVDTIKIDQSFVRGVESNPRQAALARSLVTLARGLGHRVVAEGVETAAAGDLLAEMQCEEAQGYHFGRPMEVEGFAGWLAARGHVQRVAAA